MSEDGTRLPFAISRATSIAYGEERGMHAGHSGRSIEIRTAIVLSQFCRMTTEIPGRCGVGEPLWVRHWCRGSGGMPSRGTWAAASHSMPGEPSCPERKSVQIRFLAHAVDAGVGRLPRFYECCGCVEIFNRVPAGVHNVSTIGFSSECRGRGRNCCKCLKER